MIPKRKTLIMTPIRPGPSLQKRRKKWNGIGSREEEHTHAKLAGESDDILESAEVEVARPRRYIPAKRVNLANNSGSVAPRGDI